MEYLAHCLNRLAETVLEENWISVPVTDIDAAVRSMGGTVEERENIGLMDGTAMKESADGFRIAVPAGLEPRKRTFRAAHELGHVFMHMGFRTRPELWEQLESGTWYCFGGYDQECLANFFAGAFLMPKDAFRRTLEALADADGRIDVRRAADLFEVEPAAVLNRGRDLGMFF